MALTAIPLEPEGLSDVELLSHKPTHTDQYLDFNSTHLIEHKLNVVRTLHQRAEVVTSDKKDIKVEIDHVNEALKTCNYPKWAIKKVA